MDIELCEKCGRPVTPERVKNDVRICAACERPDKFVTVTIKPETQPSRGFGINTDIPYRDPGFRPPKSKKGR